MYSYSLRSLSLFVYSCAIASLKHSYAFVLLCKNIKECNYARGIVNISGACYKMYGASSFEEIVEKIKPPYPLYKKEGKKKRFKSSSCVNERYLQLFPFVNITDEDVGVGVSPPYAISSDVSDKGYLAFYLKNM